MVIIGLRRLRILAGGGCLQLCTAISVFFSAFCSHLKCNLSASSYINFVLKILGKHG